MNKLYEGQMLNSVEHFVGEKIKTIPNKSDIGYLIQMYGNKDLSDVKDIKVNAEDITLPIYSSIFNGEHRQELYSFQSAIDFYHDLFIAAEEIKLVDNKKDRLKEIFQEVNLKLPACVYVPFVKDSKQFYNILNIVIEETQIFSTKQRAPFYICLEVYNPIETFPESMKDRFYDKMENPITLRVSLARFSSI